MSNTTHTPSPPTTLPAALNEVEAAAILGVHPRTLANWRSQRRGPKYIAVGRRRVYRVEDILNYMSAHAVDPETQR